MLFPKIVTTLRGYDRTQFVSDVGAGIIVDFLISALGGRMAEITNVSAITREFDEPDDEGEGDPNTVRRRTVPAGVEVYKINGPFFFGAEKFKDTITGCIGCPEC